MMQKIFLFIAIFYCFNAIAQDEDPIEHDPNLIGEWEVFAYVKVNNEGLPIDTIHTDTTSSYSNLILIIRQDSSMQKILMPVNKSLGLKGSSENCRWNLYGKRGRLWLEFQCEKTGGGSLEIICISEEELHLFSEHDIGDFLLKFRRIDTSK